MDVDATQMTMFDGAAPEPAPPALGPTDPSVHRDAFPRLSRHARQIVERLLEGPATNAELSEISLKYTGRISDIRAAGIAVPRPSQDHRTGLATYRLADPEAARRVLKSTLVRNNKGRSE